jgi:ubiquinone/menaquinone biosynthesis C-methylase UbiE
MAEQEVQIRFDDGDAYERMMGVWSRFAGDQFLDWLAPASGQRWIDVGCGNGAFTDLIFARCAPAEVQGIDPSDAQLDFARKRPGSRLAKFQQGDAMALPFSAAQFDVAVMALVIFFVPDPVRGVAEMVRVLKPGGTVAAYSWDIPGGGLPMHAISLQMRAMGITQALPPSFEISRMDALQDLWKASGLRDVDTKEIVVERLFPSFEEYWTNCLLGPSMSQTIARLTPDDIETLKRNVQANFPADSAGRVTCVARANAIRGRKP